MSRILAIFLCTGAVAASKPSFPDDVKFDLSLIDQSKTELTSGPKMPKYPVEPRLNMTSSWVYYGQCDPSWASQVISEPFGVLLTKRGAHFSLDTKRYLVSSFFKA